MAVRPGAGQTMLSLKISWLTGPLLFDLYAAITLLGLAAWGIVIIFTFWRPVLLAQFLCLKGARSKLISPLLGLASALFAIFLNSFWVANNPYSSLGGPSMDELFLPFWWLHMAIMVGLTVIALPALLLVGRPRAHGYLLLIVIAICAALDSPAPLIVAVAALPFFVISLILQKRSQ